MVVSSEKTSLKESPYQRVSGAFDKLVNWVGKGLVAIAAGVLAILALVTFTDVFLRYLFNRPIAESYELTQICLLIITFFGLAWVGIKKSNIRIDVVTSHLPPRVNAILSLIVDPMCLILFIFLTWQAYEQVIIILHSGQIFSNLRFPVYIVRIFLLIGCLAFCLVLIRDIFGSFYRLYRTERGLFWKGLSLSVIVNLLVCLVPVWYKLAALDLTTVQLSIIGVLVFFSLMFMGMTLAAGLSLVGFIGVGCLGGMNAGLNLIGTTPPSVSMNYTFSVIPLFVLMGMFAFHSNIIADLYYTASKWVGRLPGGLAVASIAGCAGFAAVCGSSVASAAAMSTICYPELKKYKYNDGLAAGSIAAGGTLGIMIPPSLDFIIYGVLTLTSIGSLFMAGIIPGLIMTSFFMLTALFLCRRQPALGPPVDVRYPFREKLRSLLRVWPVLALFLLVIGGIYMGLFTATEGASIGAIGAFVIALVRKSLNPGKFFNSLRDTIENSSMLLIILVGAMIFGYFLALTGVPTRIAEFLSALDVNRWVVIGMIMVTYLILGCLMDAFSIMIITVPILFPTVMALGFDPIWYGVLMISTVELGLITPPFGVAAFVVSGTTRVPMGIVFRGIVPFLLADLLVVALLIAFPSISLLLPSLMQG